MSRLAGFVVLTLLIAGAARAADTSALEQKAKAAFALGRYAEAGESYEKAFEIRTDSALLYNAAQSYRLAGNKERALLLYQNYLRVFGDQEKRAEIQTRIDELTAAIAHDKAVATSPPTGTVPTNAPIATNVSTATAAPTVPAAPSPPATAAPVLTASATPPADERPLTHKAWFWGTVGGGVVVAAIVIVLVAMGGSAKDPSPSLGMVDGYR
jgi:tetratricopeptide (TPR) repeat protein